ncbi:MAG TPA: hypothetical protein VKQ30_03165 [Ktedonobacterales bacterium]|nr:hypothetical protein [Ktedonobacterales bacterium]
MAEEIGGLDVPELVREPEQIPQTIIVDPVQEALAASRRASERSEEAAERAINEMAALRDHLSRRFDELGNSFVEHTHSVLQPAEQIAELPVEAAEDVAEDVAEAPEAIIGEPEAEKPPMLIQKRNRFRLRR